VAEPLPSRRPRSGPGMSATTNSVSSSSAHHAEVRFERGEGIVGDLRLGRRDHADQRGLAGVGEPDEGHVGQQLAAPCGASAPRRPHPARRSPVPGAGSRGTWRCPDRRCRPPRRATGRRVTRSARTLPVLVLTTVPSGTLTSSRRPDGRGALPLPWVPSSARRNGWSRKASSEATLWSATSHTSPPLPPSPPSGPPAAPALTTERHAARATVASLDVETALVDELGHRGESRPTGARGRLGSWPSRLVPSTPPSPRTPI
jgi:hypothetical protein